DLARAEKVWFTLSFALFVWFAYECSRLLPHSVESLKWIACAFIIISMPVTLTLRLGQINALIAALVLFDLLLMMRYEYLGGVGFRDQGHPGLHRACLRGRRPGSAGCRRDGNGDGGDDCGRCVVTAPVEGLLDVDRVRHQTCRQRQRQLQQLDASVCLVAALT